MTLILSVKNGWNIIGSWAHLLEPSGMPFVGCITFGHR